MTFWESPYAIHVILSYFATVAVVGWLVWSSLRANLRARAELEAAEKERDR
ncbi:MAG: heme exporter protein CcmD [Paracoccaceae bacterium]